MSAARYVALILMLAGAAAAGAFLCRESLPPTALTGTLIGLGLGAFGAISWFAGAAWGARRGMQALMAVVVLGILGRLVIYSATLAYVALGTGISLAWTGGALAGSSMIFIVLEVLYAHRALGAGTGTVRRNP
ncbi:MAG TPA: hypothetical protein VJV75_02045 [Candidatus Polarisedimenticolia bacterium]|nr:hypothetical protein [Candidatus Polarisedimenticolia bacterium]